jgi:predicted porin
MNYSTPLKGIGLTAVAAALLAVSPVASALDVELSGHVDRMIRAADNGGNDNGQGSDIQHLDNGSDQSRVRLTGRQDVDGGTSSSGSGIGGPYAVGFDLEMRFFDSSVFYDVKDETGLIGGVLPSGLTDNFGETDGDGVASFARADLFFDSQYGKVSIGKGDDAARGAGRADLSETDLVLNYDPRRNASISFIDSGNNAQNVMANYGTVFRFYEGARSQNRIRYDTPVWGGLQLGVSNSNTDKYAAGLTYAYGADNDPTQIRVGAGYNKTGLNNGNCANAGLFQGNGQPGCPDQFEDSRYTISGSVLFGGGFNLTAGYGKSQANQTQGPTPGPEVKDQSTWQAKLGYVFGGSIKSAVAFRYMSTSDVSAYGTNAMNGFTDGKSYGLAWQTACTDWMDVYVGYERAELDNLTVGANTDQFESQDIFTVGAKAAF